MADSTNQSIETIISMKRITLLTALFVFAAIGISWGQHEHQNESHNDHVSPKDTVHLKENEQIEELSHRIEELESEIHSMHHGNNMFMFSGFTNLTYRQSLDDIHDSKFGYAGFSPVMMFMPSDKLFFEAEIQMEMEGGVHGGEIHGGSIPTDLEQTGSTKINLGYAHMVYELNNSMILGAGEFLTPIGIYNERAHPSWINPLPIDPIGYGHGGPLPSTELGVQVRGALQTGLSKFSYTFYLSNGPVLDDGSIEPESAGKLIYSNFLDNNGNKAIGGRIGYLPFPSSSFELGLSGQYAGKTGDHGTEYEDVKSGIFAADFNYVNHISKVGIIRWSGQYSGVYVGNALYPETPAFPWDPVTYYSFNNHSEYFYTLLSLKGSGFKKPFLRKSELSLRYESGKTPEGSHWHIEEHTFTAGYSFWIHDMAVIKLAGSFGEENTIFAQIAYGF